MLLSPQVYLRLMYQVIIYLQRWQYHPAMVIQITETLAFHEKKHIFAKIIKLS